MKRVWFNSEHRFFLKVTSAAENKLHFSFKIFIVIMYWQTQTADASVCLEILDWKGSSIFPLREGEIQLKDLEKILSGELCLLQLQMQCSPASCCFPVGAVEACVLVCVPVCQRLWGEGACYKIKLLSSQSLRTGKRSESSNVEISAQAFSLLLHSRDWISDTKPLC